MKVFRHINEVDVQGHSVVTVGSFDGVHLGHQAIIRSLNRAGEQCHCLPILVTFHPHPKMVVGPSNGRRVLLLTTLEEKLDLLEEYGLPAVLIIPFTREFSRTTYDEFVRKYLVDILRVKKMVIGHDHHFGRNREGHEAQLREFGRKYGFEVEALEPYFVDGEIVSSTRIREYLMRGEIKRANRLLGRYYSVRGKVVEGDHRGRKLGFPTANIRLTHLYKLLPRNGVYAVEVRLKNGVYKGMMNIGHRPTFNFDPLTLEVHIINFTGSIYGEDIEVAFKDFVREERQFRSAEELREQLQKDREKCLNI